MSISLSLKNLFLGESIVNQSNEALILRYAAKHESQVLAQLYDNCERDLYHFLLSLADVEIAQETSQRTWLKVIEKAHLYRDDSSAKNSTFKSWLFTIGRRSLIDEYRKLGRFQELFDDTAELGSPLEAHSSNAGDAEGLVLTDVEMSSANQSHSSLMYQFSIALKKLPFAQKEAFCLQQEEFSLAEIAQLTATEIETVKSRIRYAKQALKKHLEKYRD